MAKLLVTGFGVHEFMPNNPSQQVAERLDGEVIAGTTVVSAIIPVTFARAVGLVAEALRTHEPVAVILMGVYDGRAMLTLERVAQNYADGTRYGLADIDGFSPQGPVDANGPPAIYSTLPLRAMVKAMRAEGVPADISDCAGTFLCNYLMYGVLHYIQKENLPIRAGFLHLPLLPETAALKENLGLPSMSVDTAARGLKAAIQALLAHDEDIDEPCPSRWQD